MRVALIGGPRFGAVEPVAGGLEALVLALGRRLRAGGHEVTVFAGVGAGPTEPLPGFRLEPLVDAPFEPGGDARADVSMPPEQFLAEHHAYLRLNIRLRHSSYDVIHNHSLHYLPPVFDVATPMVHTLHSPPTPWLQSAFACRARVGDVVASVSAANAARWGDVVDCVVPNGVDAGRWRPGGDRAERVFWSGRVVPEKAPHLAVDAARLAGRPIALAGPIHDRAYFEAELAPRLGADAVHLGHLPIDELVGHLARSAVAVVTPMWDEPYGLVVAEALACGTPVAAFARGGIPEIVDGRTGVLAAPGDVAALADAIGRAALLDPAHCRQRAVEHCSLDVMTGRYVELYRRAGELAGAR